MHTSVGTRELHSGTVRAAPLTPAARAEADTAHDPRAQLHTDERVADRRDADSVEHERKSRLARWQRQQGDTIGN